MTIDRRLVAGLIVAPGMALARPLVTFADAVADPGTAPTDSPIDLSGLYSYIGVAIVILVTALFIRSPGSRRPIAALLVFVGTALGAMIALIGPGMACFDCGVKPDQTLPTIIAVVIVVVGIALEIRIIGGGTASAAAEEAASTRTD
jgi:hypothetical protein